MTFVIVGGGPTGVELAGALGEMSRYTLAKDFRNIDSKSTRVILLEGGSRILPSFSPRQSSKATRDLERLGVQVWTKSFVTNITEGIVEIGHESVRTATVLWAAGVQASDLGADADLKVDRNSRVFVGEDLSVPDYPNVFVGGDAAHFSQKNRCLPAQAPVALQMGKHIGKQIMADVRSQPRHKFKFLIRAKWPP